MEILIWIGLSQSLFEGILIVTKKQSSISDKILSAWLFLFAASFLFTGLQYQLFKQPLLTNVFLIINPASYLYIKSLTKRDFSLKWIQLLHLLPFVFFEIIILGFEIPLSATSINLTDKLVFSLLFIGTTVFSWLIYNILSIIMVHKHRKGLENEFSNIEGNVKLGWLLFIVIFYVSFCMIDFGFGIYIYISNTNLEFIHWVTYPFFLFFVYALGYYGLKQRIVFKEQAENLSVKYANSAMSQTKKKDIKKIIYQLFDTSQPFLDPDFNMDTLSQLSGFPKHQITEVLSTEIKQNFFLFVNTYRVEAVKKHLQNKNNHYSIEAIGYECGFNSKSTFFTIFKKFTDKTPSQYRDSLN